MKIPSAVRDFRPIRSISLSGFKTLRELKKFSLSPGLNVLIGGNGAGKTNFIRFFEMLGNMMDANLGLQNYVTESGGADAFLFRGVEVTSEFSAKLWFNLNRYEFSLRSTPDGTLFFSQEIVHYDGPHFGSRDYDQGQGHKESKLVTYDTEIAAEKWVVETIRGWRVYHFHNTNPKAPMMRSVNAVDNDQLWPDAGNIAAFLWHLKQERNDYYQRIVMHIRQAAPYFGDFELRPNKKGQIQLLWREKYSQKLYYPSQLSDGSIRFICLSTLLLQPDPPSTIIIDEPELGLHPYAITILAGMFRLAAKNCQLIVSTQSSPLVDYLDLDDIITVDRKDGETELSRPNTDALDEWLKEYSVGTLWDKNLLGGRPLP